MRLNNWFKGVVVLVVAACTLVAAPPSAAYASSLPPLPAPTIQCNPDFRTSMLEREAIFRWDEVDGATNYIVTDPWGNSFAPRDDAFLDNPLRHRVSALGGHLEHPVPGEILYGEESVTVEYQLVAVNTSTGAASNPTPFYAKVVPPHARGGDIPWVLCGVAPGSPIPPAVRPASLVGAPALTLPDDAPSLFSIITCTKLSKLPEANLSPLQLSQPSLGVTLSWRTSATATHYLVQTPSGDLVRANNVFSATSHTVWASDLPSEVRNATSPVRLLYEIYAVDENGVWSLARDATVWVKPATGSAAAEPLCTAPTVSDASAPVAEWPQQTACTELAWDYYYSGHSARMTWVDRGGSSRMEIVNNLTPQTIQMGGTSANVSAVGRETFTRMVVGKTVVERDISWVKDVVDEGGTFSLVLTNSTNNRQVPDRSIPLRLSFEGNDLVGVGCGS